MDNQTIKQALVTKHLTGVLSDDAIHEELNTVFCDASKNVMNFVNSTNPDKRVIAIGSNDEIWRWETQAFLTPDWTILTKECALHASVMLVSAIKPEKMLITSPESAGLIFAHLEDTGRNPDITFVNTLNLFFYEKFIREVHSAYNFTYSVVDISDLNQEGQVYDFIFSYSWDVANNLEYLQSLIDALQPGGTMVIMLTNNNGRIYSENFESHALYEMHEILKSQPSSTTTHNPAFYGTTVFTKN
jgi:hypothetical protein